MKIERLTIDLSRNRATVLYDDGKQTPMTIPAALSLWQESHRHQGLPIGDIEISSVDDLLCAMATLSKNHKRNSTGKPPKD